MTQEERVTERKGKTTCDLIREGERGIVCVCARESLSKYVSVSDDQCVDDERRHADSRHQTR